MYCTNCGVQLDDNAIFCPNCGQKVGRRANHGRNIMDDLGSSSYAGHRPRNRITAGLLALFLGSMGIHNFYLGYTKKAIVQLLLFIFSLGGISRLWALVEAVMIFSGSIATDGEGWPLTDKF